jgi:hypothetical protein
MLGLGPVKLTMKTVPKEAGIRALSVDRVCIYVPLWNKVLSSLARLLISRSFSHPQKVSSPEVCI